MNLKIKTTWSSEHYLSVAFCLLSHQHHQPGLQHYLRHRSERRYSAFLSNNMKLFTPEMNCGQWIRCLFLFWIRFLFLFIFIVAVLFALYRHQAHSYSEQRNLALFLHSIQQQWVGGCCYCCVIEKAIFVYRKTLLCGYHCAVFLVFLVKRLLVGIYRKLATLCPTPLQRELVMIANFLLDAETNRRRYILLTTTFLIG